jgi:hypothetical protein
MSTIIVACNTIADELNLAIRTTATPHPVYWIDSKLHTKPEKLREQIQGSLDRISNVSTILLAFGFCGAGLAGVRSTTSRLILPRVEDCISLLLGSEQIRRQVSRETASYYLTRGWIESENNIGDQCDYCTRKFGPDRGLRIMKEMLKHYRHLTLIDTGAYDITSYGRKIGELAAKLGLTDKIITGSQRLLQKLLTGPWDEEFVLVDPGREIGREDFLGQYEDAMVGQV